MPSLKEMSPEAKEEAVCSLAALLLFDAGAEITADKLSEVIAASGNSVAKYWPAMFAKLVASSDVDSIIKASTTPGSGGSAKPAAGGAAPAKAAAAEVKEVVKEEAVEVDMSGGGGLFGGDKKGGY